MMADGAEVKVDIAGNTPLIEALWIVAGIARAVERMTSVEPALQKLPGLGLARALIDRELAEARTQLHGLTLKAAARAGHDISTTKSIAVAFEGETPVLVVTFGDLIDVAEA